MILGYFLTGSYRSCLDDDKLPVHDLRSCKEAVRVITNEVAAAQFGEEETQSDWPKGCYYWSTNARVYFNRHSYGSVSRNGHAHQICKGKEKQINITIYYLMVDYICP